jgi:hypothetical protein
MRSRFEVVCCSQVARAPASCLESRHTQLEQQACTKLRLALGPAPGGEVAVRNTHNEHACFLGRIAPRGCYLGGRRLAQSIPLG